MRLQKVGAVTSQSLLQHRTPTSISPSFRVSLSAAPRSFSAVLHSQGQHARVVITAIGHARPVSRCGEIIWNLTSHMVTLSRLSFFLQCGLERVSSSAPWDGGVTGGLGGRHRTKQSHKGYTADAFVLDNSLRQCRWNGCNVLRNPLLSGTNRTLL